MKMFKVRVACSPDASFTPHLPQLVNIYRSRGSLIVPFTFLLTACAFLHRQSLILIADRPFHAPAHGECVSAPINIAGHVPCVFLLKGGAFLHSSEIPPPVVAP